MGQVCNPLNEPDDCNPFAEKNEEDKTLESKLMRLFQNNVSYPSIHSSILYIIQKLTYYTNRLQKLSKGSMIKWEGAIGDIPKGWKVYEGVREDSNTNSNTNANENTYLNTDKLEVNDQEPSMSETTASAASAASTSTATQTAAVTIVKYE